MSSDTLATRLRTWIEARLNESGKTQAELAVQLGIAPSAVSRILKGQRQISALELVSIVDFLGTSFEAVELALNGEVDLKKEIGLASGSEAAVSNTIVGVNSFWGHRVIPYEEDGDELTLPREFLTGKRFPSEMLRWIYVGDEAMSPTLNTRDVVVFDASVNFPGRPGLYIVGIGPGAVGVRRLEIDSFDPLPTTVLISADNKLFASRRVALDHVEIVGICLLRLTTNMS